MENIKALVDADMGREKIDFVLKGGNVVDVFCGKIIKTDVAVKNGYICGVGDYSCENNIDVSGKYVMPSFIDSHLHIESSMVTPAEYAKVAVSHGVTTIIADPHEITNVCGENGLKYMKEASKGLPMDINFMLPSCVPSVAFEHTGYTLSCEDTKRLAPEFFGIAEMMNFPGVVSGNEEVLGKLCKEHIDGHAPLLSGKELDAYISSGIKTDHECSNTDEMFEKISKGMYVAIREGSLSKDIARLYKGINSYTLKRCLFCTDDRFIGEIEKEGSIDYCIKKSISLGVNPVDAIIIATINAAECYGLKDKGAVAPSYLADIVVADSLELNNIELVYKQGALIAKDGKTVVDCSSYADTSIVTNTVHLNKVTADDFKCETPEEFSAIELIPHAIITKKVRAKRTDELSKVCVLERHKNLGTKGIGFVTNFGIKNAALALSIGHDSHNVIVIGDNDEDMAVAVNTLSTVGGIALCSKGEVVGYLPLEIAGLMSTKSADEVAKLHDYIYEKARQFGVSTDVDPFLAPAFMPLPVIPEIRITDLGLFDVTKFEFVKD